MELGFVGLGNIGLPLCERLLGAGHTVTVFDIADRRLAAAVECGAITAAGPRDVGARADIVFTCLPSPESVEAVVSAPDGVLRAERAQIVVDLSTNDPRVVRELAERAASMSAHFLDSPVAGGVPGARAGTLTLMVGGDDGAFARVLPLLRCLGSTVFHLGPAGSGSVAKLVNNLLAFCNMAAAAEAFILSKRAGIEPEKLLEVLEAGSGGSAALERYRRKIIPGDFSAEFTVDLALKDLGLAMDLGDRHGVPMPFASAVKVALQQAHASGHGDLDVCGLVRVAEEITGEEIRMS